jgi:hypothetical protein
VGNNDMRVNTKAKPGVFNGESGEKLTLSPSNMGEPYRDGVVLNRDGHWPEK